MDEDGSYPKKRNEYLREKIIKVRKKKEFLYERL